MIAPILGGVGLLLLLSGRKSSTSSTMRLPPPLNAPTPTSTPSPGVILPIKAEWVPWVMDVLGDGVSLDSGWSYYWGGPTSGPDAKVPPKKGIMRPNLRADCSGATWEWSVLTGIVPEGTPRWTSLVPTVGGIYGGKVRVSEIMPGNLLPGDIVEYNGHQVPVVGGSGITATVIDMTGGGSSTHGDNPKARAKLQPANYRTILHALRFSPL